MKEDSEIVLSGHQVEFFEYFIAQYHKHVEKGEVNESHHCSVAVLLELEKLLPGSM